MKPHYHLVPGNIEEGSLSRRHILPNFGTVWHYHPELEFHYIIRGEGIKLVGDNVSPFGPGELLLLGPDLPHMWRCNEEYFRSDPNVQAEAIVIHFAAHFMGRDFLRKPEAEPILHLYEKARKGLVISGKTKESILQLMEQLVHCNGLSRIVHIISMLNILCESSETEAISSDHLIYKTDKAETDRLDRICSFTLEQFKRDIPLEEISAKANMTVPAFCRYFKMMTKKTYHRYLVEVRISHAKRLLIENKLATTQLISFDCGFNQLSNFYKHFKLVTGLTPVEYRKKHLYQNVFF